MHRKNGHTLYPDEAAALRLSIAMSKLLRHLLSHTGYTQSGFASAIGYSRVTLNQVLKSEDGRYLWRLPLICAVTRILGVGIPEFISAAEEFDRGETRGLLKLTSKIGRNSVVPLDKTVRLREYIAKLLNLCHDMPGGPTVAPKTNDDYERIFRCSPLEIQQGAPEFYKFFCDEQHSEMDAFPIILKAVTYVQDNGGPDKMPLWAALKAVYK